MKRAFTIVELLVVIGVLSVLLTLTFVSVKGAMIESRKRHKEALCESMQAGLAAYYAQFGKWPGPVGEGDVGSSNGGRGGPNDPLTRVLTEDEVRKTVRDILDEAKKGNTLMDISGLFVSRDGRYGLDFSSAIRGTRKSSRRMRTSEMRFGYPDPDTARFVPFKMTYSIPTDSFTVE